MIDSEVQRAGTIIRALAFELTAERPRHWFGVDLVGQTYERSL